MIRNKTKQKIVEKQRLPEESETRIDSLLNEMPPPLMPRQEAARKENIEVMGDEEVNADEATEGEERDKNRVGEDNVREELQPLRRSTRIKRPLDVYQAGSS